MFPPSFSLSLSGTNSMQPGSGPCWWRDGVTQAGHVGRRPLCSTCLAYKAHLPPSHQFSPFLPPPFHMDTGRSAATSPYSAFHHSVTACQLRSPSPAQHTHWCSASSAVLCFKTPQCDIWITSPCALCAAFLAHTYSYAKPLSSRLVTAPGCDNERVTVGWVMGWSIEGGLCVYVYVCEIPLSSTDHLSTAASVYEWLAVSVRPAYLPPKQPHPLPQLLFRIIQPLKSLTCTGKENTLFLLSISLCLASFSLRVSKMLQCNLTQ